MKTIGLTGGIGSGKSAVASYLVSMGVPVYIADDQAKKLTNTSLQIRDKLTQRFGEQIYQQGVLNKLQLASLIFGNEENLKWVNSVIHPEVFEDFALWKEKHKNVPFVVMEAAILFESGFDKYMDVVWTVYAPVETRIRRLIKRENASREMVLKRIQAQFPDEEKCRLSDFIIYNDDHEAIIPQIEDLMNKLEIDFL